MTKTVLITGGAGGIGREFSKLFAQDGYRLVVFDVLDDQLKSLGEELKGVDYTPVKMDLAQPKSAEQVVAWLAENNVQVDVLLNNVGFGMMGEHVEQDSDKLERMLTLNNILLSKLCMLIGKQMKERRSGHIINIASLAGFCPMTYFAAYSASKAFVINLTASLHQELKAYGVKLTCFCPTTTKTAFLSTAQSAHQTSTGITNFVSAGIQTPDQVAKAGYAAYKKGKLYALPNASLTFQSIMIRTLPLRYMSWFVRWQSERNA